MCYNDSSNSKYTLLKDGVTMNERDLLIIKYLRDFKNITKTAKALFVSQPALTTRIKQIEKELNTHLISSNNKGIYLTATGIEMATFAETVLKEFDDFRDRIQAIDDENSGVIRIAAPVIIAEYYLPQVIKSFKEKFPNVKFYIITVSSSEVISLMNNNTSDFGFSRNDFGWEDDERHLLSTSYITAISLTPFKLADLPNMSRVAYTTDSYYMKMLNLWWEQHFDTPPKVDVWVNTLDLCKEMVYKGLGYGILPSVFIAEAPTAYSVILKSKQNVPIKRNTWLIYKKHNLNTKILKKFMEFMKTSNFDAFFHILPR